MPTSAELSAYLLERLKVLDPTMDVSEGSPAQRIVVDPLAAKLGVDPFTTDVRTFILSRLRSEFPDLDVSSAGSALGSLLGSSWPMLRLNT